MSCLVDAPFPYDAIAEDTPAVAFNRVLDNAGCSFARDSYDSDIIRQVREGKGENGRNGIIDSPDDVGGWPTLRKGTPQPDNDGDGMPDQWETSHRLDPNDPSDATTHTLDPAYTNIEVYINELTQTLR